MFSMRGTQREQFHVCFFHHPSLLLLEGHRSYYLFFSNLALYILLLLCKSQIRELVEVASCFFIQIRDLVEVSSCFLFPVSAFAASYQG